MTLTVQQADQDTADYERGSGKEPDAQGFSQKEDA
jgi:hypothetical protein